MSDWFARLSSRVAALSGHWLTFILMSGLILTWLLVGPLFRFSTTWQLWINTGTTIVTFLMVFLIQNTQNRDSRAVHLKLDEIILSIDAAENELIVAEEGTDAEVEARMKTYKDLAKKDTK